MTDEQIDNLQSFGSEAASSEETDGSKQQP